MSANEKVIHLGDVWIDQMKREDAERRQMIRDEGRASMGRNARASGVSLA